jgi:hypothetical protein
MKCYKLLLILYILLLTSSCTMPSTPFPTQIPSTYTPTITTIPIHTASTPAITTLPFSPTNTFTVIPKTATPSATSTTVIPTKTPFWNHSCYQKGTPVPILYVAPHSNREYYREIDIDQGVCLGSSYAFRNDFDIAVINKEDWIQFPEKIALRITCFPHPDIPCPDEMIFHQISKEEIVILETLWRVFDDQWGALEYRVDLKFNNDYWFVEWAGQRWQCKNNRGEWTIGVC